MNMSTFRSHLVACADGRARTDCWPWIGEKAPDGTARWMRRQPLRLVYKTAFGPLPRGKTVRRTCATPDCVNPTHLEVVDVTSDLRRTHCRRGHELTPENTYYVNERGLRICRECVLLRRNPKYRRGRYRATNPDGIVPPTHNPES